MNQTVLILDFGGQYKELIARRVRELRVLSLVMPGNTPIEKIREINPIAIIFTGGPSSVYAPGAPTCDPAVFSLGIPVLGICYGMHLMCHLLGGTVSPCEKSEYGLTDVTLDAPSAIFEGLAPEQIALMSHGDQVTALPEGFAPLAHTETCPIAAMACPEKRLYAVQFHPEVETTKHGLDILRHFLYEVSGATGDYTMQDVLRQQIAAVRAQVGDKKVLLALSGGVDSSVCAALLSRAIPGQLVCIFVDHGFMRKNEGDEIEAAFGGRDLTFIRVNAQDRFIDKLAGVSEPETKRKLIGAEFARVFEDEAKKLTGVSFLAQGTIYPDVIESGGGDAATIKSHHNVGGLPKDLGFEGVVEPLRGLFKDEVRKLGRLLKLPPALVMRQPFPGPGLAIRVIGEVTRPRLAILREADAIYREELTRARVKADQYFAVLTNVQSVGVMGDGRTYDYTVALRAVRTNDFMTCEAVRLPYPLLMRATARITAEVDGVNRVVYDVTGKPPATIEWE
ncbi:MAG: glutamine-hydrolyzing GMP synthase [Oscillospiraceae bacterium]|jgi:GMP synthase (glutamine-hydrolysing)|nr:glutamine-hydrolyzing GMP synthase [Oscillospiraceae bacterium]